MLRPEIHDREGAPVLLYDANAFRYNRVSAPPFRKTQLPRTSITPSAYAWFSSSTLVAFVISVVPMKRESTFTVWSGSSSLG
jgi:hypothetical protein